jgi:hypothetical protein
MKYEAKALRTPVNDEFYSNSGMYKVITYVKYWDCFHSMTNLAGEKRNRLLSFNVMARFEYMKTNHSSASQYSPTFYIPIFCKEKIPRLTHTSVMWTSNTWK